MSEEKKPFVQLTPAGVRIAGRPELLLCASLFYFRIPRECWRDRMRKVKLAGYRAIDVYFPWNYHEQAEGDWDFAEEKDVGHFLQLAAEEELFVIARPGPYICSEWDGGALPAYLLTIPGIRLRDNDPVFLQHTSRWFGQILPILKRYEAGRGGTVIALQLENELDFYDCLDPRGYMSALRDMATDHGLTIPMIACAGQGDLQRATGNADSVLPACNFYPNNQDPAFEEKVLAYAERVGRRGAPLLVTETNRSHFLLRRLLGCGAKLLGPYLQASGTDYGFTNAINNWGKPLALLTSDYDFGGMLSPEGHFRGEAEEGRLLAHLIRSYGPMLAEAEVEPEPPLQLEEEGAPAGPGPFSLRLSQGGRILSVPNPTDRTARWTIRGKEESFPRFTRLVVKRTHCPLLPVCVPLESWGVTGELLYSTAELAFVRTRAERTVLLFHAMEEAELSFRFRSKPQIEAAGLDVFHTEDRCTFVLREIGQGQTIRLTWEGTGGQSDFQLEIHVLERTAALKLEHIDWEGSPVYHSLLEAPQAEETDAIASWSYTALDSDESLTEAVRSLGGQPGFLEMHGIYRGFSWYSAVARSSKGSVDGILLHDAADVLSVFANGSYLGTVTPGGGSAFLPWRPIADEKELRISVRTEIWGHSNFDDARLPALRLHSMKGLSGLAIVTGRHRLDSNWTYKQTEAPDSGHAEPAPPVEDDSWPIVGWNGWFASDASACGWYCKTVPGRADADDWTLHFPGLQAKLTVYVNGSCAGTVNPFAPFLSITAHVRPGEPIRLALLLQKTGDAGQVWLYEGVKARDWKLSEAGEKELWRNAQSADSLNRAMATKLPLILEPGATGWLHGNLPRTGAAFRVRFRGRHIKLSLFLDGRLCGRVWLPGESSRPSMKGGSADSVYLTVNGAGKVAILLEAVEREREGALEQVSLQVVSNG